MGNPWLQCLPPPQPLRRKRHGFQGLGHRGKFLEAAPPGPGAPIKRLPVQRLQSFSLVNSDDITGRERSPSKLDLESQKGVARRQEKEQSLGSNCIPAMASAAGRIAWSLPSWRSRASSWFPSAVPVSSIAQTGHAWLPRGHPQNRAHILTCP